MLLLYESKVREEFGRTRALAHRLREKFNSKKVKPAELLQDRARRRPFVLTAMILSDATTLERTPVP
jgi:hypothetical protein